MTTANIVRNQAFTEVSRLAATLSRLDKEVAKDLRRDMKREAVDPLAEKIRARGRMMGPQTALATKSVRTRAGNKPTLVGAARGTGTAADVFYGTEFGGGERVSRYIGSNGRTWRGIVYRHTTHQFPDSPGWRKGRWFHPALEANLPETTGAIWRIVNDAVMKVM